MELRRGHKGEGWIRPVTPEMVASALVRFLRFCRFEPETGCVLWTGGVRMGRGKHVPYPNFWFNGANWLGHRWSAKFIHGQEIEGFHTDHCCPAIPIPNTLCVQHVQSLTLRDNVLMQHERRKRFIHMQVGLLPYEEVYRHGPEIAPPDPEAIPFFSPPAWLATHKDVTDGDCPF